jgi:hypothetical protein
MGTTITMIESPSETVITIFVLDKAMLSFTSLL